jgi:hypothetical protein
MFSSEFGIKFTKMNIDKIFVDSLGVSHLTSNANSSAQSNNTVKGGVQASNQRVMTPSFETCLGLSSLSGSV